VSGGVMRAAHYEVLSTPLLPRYLLGPNILLNMYFKNNGDALPKNYEYHSRLHPEIRTPKKEIIQLLC
jgi:hypothetical protein